MGRFEYAFVQARKNIIRNGLMTVASLFTIASCLVILGLFTIITLNVNYISDQIKEQCEIQVFLDQNASETRVKEVGKQIRALSNVKEASLFSKEDMLEYAENDMFEGREDLTLGLEDDNPFSDSYKVVLKNIELTSDTVKQIENFSGIEYVVNKQDLVNSVVSLSKGVKKFSIVIMLMLMLIAIVIISNTIKLTVFNRRKEINIMKYIGATDRFIRVPFIIEGVTIGFLGAVIAFGIVSWGYIVICNMVEKSQFVDMFALMGYNSLWIVIAVMFAVSGCFIGMFGSMISMRRYLNV